MSLLSLYQNYLINRNISIILVDLGINYGFSGNHRRKILRKKVV
jgi:hypothetical protein